jgi:hypothetical protein
MILNEHIAILCDQKLHVSFWHSQNSWREEKYTCGLFLPDGELIKTQGASIESALVGAAKKAGLKISD